MITEAVFLLCSILVKMQQQAGSYSGRAFPAMCNLAPTARPGSAMRNDGACGAWQIWAKKPELPRRNLLIVQLQIHRGQMICCKIFPPNVTSGVRTFA